MRFFIKISLIYFFTNFVIVNATPLDIQFLGRDAWKATEICDVKTMKTHLKTWRGESFDDLMKNLPEVHYQLGACFPNIDVYAGLKLVKKINVDCSSNIEYDPITLDVTNIELVFEKTDNSYLNNIITEKYGNASVSGDISWWRMSNGAIGLSVGGKCTKVIFYTNSTDKAYQKMSDQNRQKSMQIIKDGAKKLY